MLMETLEYLGIAFISSVLLIIMSKIILQALIRRPADYYNARELREEELMLNAGGISITLEHETNPEGEIIEDSHLEAQLGDSEAAEPEEIMLEVPEAVAESLEVIPHEDESDSDGEDSETAYEAAYSEETEPAETDSASASSGPVISGTPEEKFGFSIKARTSRNRKVRNIEEEEAAEELELARAAMEEAKADSAGEGQDNEPAPISEWSESYAEIRSSLEKAYADNRNKPSMRMTKKQLTEIAESLGLEVSEKATKKIILGMIEKEMGIGE